jgi:hypothetical protein
MLGLVEAQVVEREVVLDKHSIGHPAKSFQCQRAYSSTSFGDLIKFMLEH